MNSSLVKVSSLFHLVKEISFIISIQLTNAATIVIFDPFKPLCLYDLYSFSLNTNNNHQGLHSKIGWLGTTCTSCLCSRETNHAKLVSTVHSYHAPPSTLIFNGALCERCCTIWWFFCFRSETCSPY